MIGTLRTSARDPKLSHAEALRQSMLVMIDGAKSDAEADPWLWAPFVAAESQRSRSRRGAASGGDTGVIGVRFRGATDIGRRSGRARNRSF